MENITIDNIFWDKNTVTLRKRLQLHSLHFRYQQKVHFEKHEKSSLILVELDRFIVAIQMEGNTKCNSSTA